MAARRLIRVAALSAVLGSAGAAGALARGAAAAVRAAPVGPQVAFRYYAGGPSGPPPPAYTEIVLRTARDRRHVTVLEAGGATPCGEVQSTSTPSVAVDRTGRFTARVTVADFWTDTSSVSAGTLFIAGRFGSRSLASGSQVLRDAVAVASCVPPATWKGHLQPLYDLFRGSSEQGTAVSFLRSETAPATVRDPVFGKMVADCPGGGSAIESVSAPGATMPVSSRSFGVDTFTGAGDSITLRGSFDDPFAASGYVGFAGQDGCGFDGVRWSATLATSGVLGPVPAPA